MVRTGLDVLLGYSPESVYQVVLPNLALTCCLTCLLQFISLTFWGLYALDREIIYPAYLDEFIPQILNHYWVSTPVAKILSTSS